MSSRPRAFVTLHFSKSEVLQLHFAPLIIARAHDHILVHCRDVLLRTVLWNASESKQAEKHN